MPYLTPDETPEERDCRALLIPASTDWLAIFSGALTELTKAYNWQAQGMSVDDALIVVNEVINAYYEGCVNSGCNGIDGSGIWRVNEDGHLEQLVDGEWVTPSGEWAIPAVPARTEPTPEERRCLAAANATNVLHELYETLTDAFNEDKTLEEAIAAVLLWIATRFFWLAPIASWLLFAAMAALAVIYFLMELFLVDLWYGDFDEKLKCILYECSSDDGDVVTFNYECVKQGLEDELDEFDLDALQRRLLVQLGFILDSIGGVDALNHAGATTEIETADCDDCDDTWCYSIDFTTDDGGFVPATCGGTMGVWTTAVGWEADDVTACGGFNRTVLNMRLIFDFPLYVNTVDVIYDYEKITSNAGTEGVGLWVDNFANDLYSVNQAAATNGVDLSINITSGIPQPISSVELFVQPAIGAHGGTGIVTIMQMTGTGDKPEFLEAYGWVEC